MARSARKPGTERWRRDGAEGPAWPEDWTERRRRGGAEWPEARDSGGGAMARRAGGGRG